MRLLKASIIAAAVLAAIPAAQAQSAYDYPWCAVYAGGSRGAGGAMSCYYRTYDQCRATMSGIGGSCVQSPYYGHGPNQRPRRRENRDY
jgi:hypothetical protein